MGDTLARIRTERAGRLTGPFAFRLVLQPAMGLAVAVRGGVHDAKLGRPGVVFLRVAPTLRTRPL